MALFASTRLPELLERRGISDHLLTLGEQLDLLTWPFSEEAVEGIPSRKSEQHELPTTSSVKPESSVEDRTLLQSIWDSIPIKSKRRNKKQRQLEAERILAEAEAVVENLTDEQLHDQLLIARARSGEMSSRQGGSTI